MDDSTAEVLYVLPYLLCVYSAQFSCSVGQQVRPLRVWHYLTACMQYAEEMTVVLTRFTLDCFAGVPNDIYLQSSIIQVHVQRCLSL